MKPFHQNTRGGAIERGKSAGDYVQHLVQIHGRRRRSSSKGGHTYSSPHQREREIGGERDRRVGAPQSIPRSARERKREGWEETGVHRQSTAAITPIDLG